MNRSPYFRQLLCVAALLVAVLAAGCEGERLSPEDDAFATTASASATADVAPSNAAPTGSVQPSRDPSELNIRERSADDYDIDIDVTIAVQIDLRSGALSLTKLTTGYRVDRAAKGTLPRRLGLRAGDELISLNEVLLLDAEAAERAYQQGLEDGRFMLLVKRGSKQRTIQYRLENGPRRAGLDGLSERKRREALKAAGVKVKPRRRPPLRPRTARSSYRAPFDDVVDALKGGVKEVGSHRFELDRDLFSLFEKYPRLLSRRIYDSSLNGGGARAASTFDSVLTAMGMQRGDIVQHIAGDPVTSQNDLAKALTAAGKLASFSVNVRRRGGDTVELSYQVVDGLLDNSKAQQAIDRWGGRFLPPRTKPSRTKLDITQWVKLTPAGHYEVQTEALTRIMNEPGAMLSDVRAIPYRVGGQERGMRISRIRRGSPAHVLGFRNGDVVMTVDGRKLITMRTFIRALQRAPLGIDVVVKIKRRGKEMTLRFRRKP